MLYISDVSCHYDMLSELLVLVFEKDLLSELSNISIISRLSVASRSLKTHFYYT